MTIATTKESVATDDPTIRLKRDCRGIDWRAVQELYRISGFDNGRPPGVLRRAYSGSYAVCFAKAGDLLVGTARAISDGIVCASIFDVCVHPDYRRRGIGTRMVRALMDDLSGQYLLLATDVPEFYNALGFKPETGAMVLA